jgi:hypothetical protein
MLKRKQPYTHASPTTGRFAAGVMRIEPRIVPPTQPVDRDPCPRCGARGNYDCGHSRVRFGAEFHV